MRIIISPAKKMNRNTELLQYLGLPVFLDRTKGLMEYMKSLPYEACRDLWKCNEKIADQNYRRFQEMELEKGLTPAILAYEGIQYQYMAPLVMEEAAYDYLEQHLRILSGFYGILRPFDGVVPYRLEMQAKIELGDWKSLYEFWGDSLSENLFAETNLILNLASKEYSRCISRYLTGQIQMITCVFGEKIDGKVKEKGTLAKMARGEMVRYLAECRAEKPEQIRAFTGLDYHFSEYDSNETTYVFLKESSKRERMEI